MSKQDVRQKYRRTISKTPQYILYTLFIPVFSKPILSVCCYKTHCLVSSEHRSQCYLKFQSCLTTEYVFGWARRIVLETLPNNMCWCRGCLLRFSDPETQLISPAVVLGESLATQNHALGRYRHTSSSRQIHNILCWLEILNYCSDGVNGNFHCSSSFL